ncbi:MAG: hypothetical protein QW165_05510 [Candidatus Woesearchaeota archaeon]
MKWALLLIFLISCAPTAQEVITKPVSEQKIISPPATAPLEPQVKVPQEIAVETTSAPTQLPKKDLSPQQECIQLCKDDCAATAQNSCTQKERSTCKSHCGNNPIIDPSACTQACAYLNQPNVCKQQMEQFCSARCIEYCH